MVKIHFLHAVKLSFVKNRLLRSPVLRDGMIIGQDAETGPAWHGREGKGGIYAWYPG